jgi:hypothetical protein
MLGRLASVGIGLVRFSLGVMRRKRSTWVHLMTELTLEGVRTPPDGGRGCGGHMEKLRGRMEC